MLPVMTPTPPPSTSTGPRLRSGWMPSDRGVGATLTAARTVGVDLAMSTAGPAVYLFTCHRCDPDLAQPFFVAADRDAAAVRHAEQFRHTVLLVTDGVPDALRRPVVLLRVPTGWRWICPGCAVHDSVSAENPIVSSGLVALSAFADHECRADR